MSNTVRLSVQLWDKEAMRMSVVREVSLTRVQIEAAEVIETMLPSFRQKPRAKAAVGGDLPLAYRQRRVRKAKVKR
jgi:hypothetical protein